MKSNNLETIAPWLQLLWDEAGSDLLLTGGSAPRLRVDGRLRPIEGVGAMSGEEVDGIVRSLLDPSQVEIFEEHLDVDFSFSWQDRARLRGSAFTQKGQTALALRMIPSRIPSFEELQLPDIAEWVSKLPRGLRLGDGTHGFGEIHHPWPQSSTRSTVPGPSTSLPLKIPLSTFITTSCRNLPTGNRNGQPVIRSGPPLCP